MQQLKERTTYRVNEYLLVLEPHEALKEEILSIRELFASKYKVDLVSSTVRLVLAKFTQYEMQESKIITRLKAIARGAQPLKVELKDFGTMPTHTLYINVTSKIPVQGLIKQIRTELQKLMKKDDIKPQFFMEPYIDVARKLAPWQYEKGWLEYSNTSFSGRFLAEKILLLKRKQGEYTYQSAGAFLLENQPVHAVQGQLF